MNKSLTQRIQESHSPFHRVLILNDFNYRILCQELGMDDYNELTMFKGLIICISKEDTLKLLLL